MNDKNRNPDHNIWNNNGTYWCHYTVHNDDHTKQRVRVSLGTDDVKIARALRNFIMKATPNIATNIPRVRGQAMVRDELLGGRASHVRFWLRAPSSPAASVLWLPSQVSRCRSAGSLEIKNGPSNPTAVR